MKVQREQLKIALNVAILNQSAQERRDIRPSDSSTLAGWREIVAAVERGEHLEIIE